MLNNIEILSRVILEDAYLEAKKVLDKASIKAASIRERNKNEVEKLKRESGYNKNQMDLVCNKKKLISLAEFKARTEIWECKEEILAAVLNKIKDEFFSIIENKDYPLLLKRLIIDALSYLKDEGADFVCRVKINDQSLLPITVFEQLSKKYHKKISLDNRPLEISGGIILYRSDFRVLYDNSLEAIFLREMEQIRCMASKIIF